MKKQNFLALILVIMGMASMNAQMRIGGSEAPNKSAVLDLNPNDNVTEGNATLGLALPRVNLRNTSRAFPLSSHVKGMTVYNMAYADDVKPGVYINNGMKWLRQLNSETRVLSVEKDSVVGNEVVDATSGGGLIRSGEGTETSPYTLGIAERGITTDKIADKSITVEKLAEDVTGKLHDLYSKKLEDFIPATPNSILISDAEGRWQAQKIPGNQIVFYYEWNEEHAEGWIDLEKPTEINPEESVPAGLYAAQIHIENSDKNVLIDYVVVDAGQNSVYSFPRKYSEACGEEVLVESCLIYISEPVSNIRMFLHTSGTLDFGLAAIVLEPVIQLH